MGGENSKRGPAPGPRPPDAVGSKTCFLKVAVGSLEKQAIEDARYAHVERFFIQHGESMGITASCVADLARIDPEQHEVFTEMYMSHPDGLEANNVSLEPQNEQQRHTERFEHVRYFRLRINVHLARVPKTAQNFIALCTGEKGMGKVSKKPLHFKNVPFHRVEPALMQGGDVTRFDGSGGESIYGKNFNDEKNNGLLHDREGIVSMANSGSKNSNSSQFFILFAPLPALDTGKTHHTIFGNVIESDIPQLARIRELSASHSGTPLVPVTIVDCGLEEATLPPLL